MNAREDAAEVPPDATQGPTPTADVGVLLVHGIGDHKEGDTLTAFGEPLVDWLREWLQGTRAPAAPETGKKEPDPAPAAPETGKKKEPPAARGTVAVEQARLRANRTEAESSAFAVATVTLEADGDRPKTTESWLFCEAWWGNSIQTPASLRLLQWLLTRGPLLTLWHFHEVSRADARRGKLLRDWCFRMPAAFVLITASQTVVLLAILLWIIPFGPWRRAVVEAVRSLTLTLGDSFVLLQNDIQRAALVGRIRTSLRWLAERARNGVIVIAHSQGSAIAHEALKGLEPTNIPKLRLFLSVGSGLEKLRFLRKVRQWRTGVVAAAAIAPLGTGGMALCAAHLYGGFDAWALSLGVVAIVSAIVAALYLESALPKYEVSFRETVRDLVLPTDRTWFRWVDLYATFDLVPMWHGSSALAPKEYYRDLLSSIYRTTQGPIVNDRSFLHDHTRYFQNRIGCLGRLWHEMSKASGRHMAAQPNPIITKSDWERLDRFDQLRSWRVWAMMWSFYAAVCAALLGIIGLRPKLEALGKVLRQWIDGPLSGAPVRIVEAIARVPARLVRASPEDVTAWLLGGAVLVGGLVLWWLVLKGAHRMADAKRWRDACAGGDVLETKRARVLARISSSLLLLGGVVPLAVISLSVAVPGLVTASQWGRVIVGLVALAAAATAALLVFYPISMPIADQPFVARLGSATYFRAVIYGFLLSALPMGLVSFALLTWPIENVSIGTIAGVFGIVNAIMWQVAGLWGFRRSWTWIWSGAVVLTPLLGVLVLLWWLWWPAAGLLTYAAIYLGTSIPLVFREPTTVGTADA